MKNLMNRVFLNEQKVKEQGLDRIDITIIKSLHSVRIALESMMIEEFHKYEISRRPEALLSLHSQWTEVQYGLQRAWKFELDEDKHPYYNLPGCKCLAPCNGKSVYSLSCVYHHNKK